MISAKCERCGSINDFADEICRKCGAELGDEDKTFYRGTADYEPQPAFTVSPEAAGETFELKPAIGPFLSVGSVLNPTISIFKDNVWLITKTVLVVFAPLEIFKALSFGNQATSWQTSWQTVVGTTLLALFCKTLIAPSLIFALVTVMRTGVAPSLNESYRWGLSRLGKLVAAASMAWFLEMLGFICLIIPGIILGLAFELIYPMAALENRGPVEILKRSYHLTKGHRWNIFLAALVVGLLAWVVTLPAGIVSAIFVSAGANYWPLQAAVSLAVDIVNESMTVLSLVIYLSILKGAPVDR